jgi:hypothetical protein
LIRRDGVDDRLVPQSVSSPSDVVPVERDSALDHEPTLRLSGMKLILNLPTHGWDRGAARRDWFGLKKSVSLSTLMGLVHRPPRMKSMTRVPRQVVFDLGILPM